MLNQQKSSKKITTFNKKKISAGSLWLSKMFSSMFTTKNNKRSIPITEKMEPEQKPISSTFGFENNATTNSLPGSLPLQKASSQQETENSHHSGSSFCSYQSHEKEIVPLGQFVRYSIKRSDQQIFQRRRITQPFQPKYEIEWQEKRWLQLDNSTNKQIEQQRKNGFSRVAIRKDASLKKHIMYDNPSEFDVLLEVSLHKDIRMKKIENESQPIACHQPSRFCVRRTRWWHTSYEVGEAYLPSWVDPDLCCNTAIMNASSVMAVMTNTSKATLSSTKSNIINAKLPDTPVNSQKTSIEQKRNSSSSAFSTIKPLKYTEPPFLLEKHVLSAVDTKKVY